MVYEDRTWCCLFTLGDCVNDKCYRALNQEEREKATAWWGGEHFPTSFSNLQSDYCGFIKGATE